MKYKELPSLEVVLREVEYDSETGEFTYKLGKQGRYKRGGIAKQKYKRLRIAGKQYTAHRIAWLIHYGEDPREMMVDHISGDTSDNRIDNLRLVTNKQNTWNRRKRNGLQMIRHGNRWMASVTKSSKRHWLRDKCPLLLHVKTIDKRRELHGEFST